MGDRVVCLERVQTVGGGNLARRSLKCVKRMLSHMRLMQRLVEPRAGAPARRGGRRRPGSALQRALLAFRKGGAIRIARAPFSRTACDGWLPCVPILVRFPGRSPSAPRPPYLNDLFRLTLLLLCTAPLASAQTQTVLFPGQSGAQLLASIRAAYLPTSYGTNDNLYANVDRTTVGGVSGVVCVYTGYFVAVRQQPVEAIRDGRLQQRSPASTRSTRSRSRASTATASSPAETDLHHLYPVR